MKQNKTQLDKHRIQDSKHKIKSHFAYRPPKVADKQNDSLIAADVEDFLEQINEVDAKANPK